ncbi:MAG TPA: hypothetical protein VGN20_05790 [Mucilaginibacter sp.]|jgi:hypothetical protein
MKSLQEEYWTPFNNILYIGDDAKPCLEIIEKFNDRLIEIEKMYSGWFGGKYGAKHDKLRHHIYYHFEGGIAVFKFRNEEALPEKIRNECRLACRDLATGKEFCLTSQN